MLRSYKVGAKKLLNSVLGIATMGAFTQMQAQKQAAAAQARAQLQAQIQQQQALEQQRKTAQQQQAIQQQQLEMSKQNQLQTERQNQLQTEMQNKANAGTAFSNRVNSNNYNRADLTKGNASKAIIGKGQLEDLQDDEDWY